MRPRGGALVSQQRPKQQVALDDLTRQRTWAELEDRTNRVARFLREDLGLAAGDHAAVLMANRVECVELMAGAIQAGIWLTPLNWHLTAEEIQYVVEDSGTRVLFADAQHEEIARQCDPGTLLLAGRELDGALAGASDAPMDRAGPAGGPMIYTSGTTGRPKGVRRHVPPTLGLALEAQRKAGAAIGLAGTGPHLITGPCYHAAPLMFAIYDQANGAPIIIMPEWREQQALELLQEREVGQTHLVPTMFVRLLRLPEEVRAQFEAPALEVVLHGAAPISKATKQQMIDWWGEVLVEYWGATESGVITLADSAEWLAHPETVGRALPAWEVFATDEAGERLPDGETGLLHARHRHIENLFEYHGAPEKTAECYLAPDVFNIGDIGRVEPDGFVYLADRKSNMIISGGVNIYPAEIEQALAGHPAVADVAVFGIPNDEWGESVKAAVELTPGYTPSPALEAELREFVRSLVAGYKVPRSIDFEEALPRHPSGKLYVRRLRDPYWRDRERRI
jgi:long-chain acyl-CoA synthetase